MTACTKSLLSIVVIALALRVGMSIADDAAPAIQATNYESGTVIQFPVPLIRGTIADKSATSVQLLNRSSQRAARRMEGLAHKGRFKVLAELVPGENELVIASGEVKVTLKLVYRPSTNPHFVRTIYATDNSGNTEYQSTIEDDPQDYEAKLDTAMKVLQTMTAERMQDLGFGRRTFNLELDDEGHVVVHTFKGERSADEYYKMPDDLWYRAIANELASNFPTGRAKNIVLAAYTRFDPEKKKVFGHTALGGGGQGLFGSGNVYTWPSSLAQVQQAFSDTRPVDGARTHDDSAGRGTFWGAASTTMGATLHEMGHAFGLMHSTEAQDIMTRGFDHLNRVFTLVEPASRSRKSAFDFRSEDEAMFAPISAHQLIASPWFAEGKRSYNWDNKTRIGFNQQSEEIVVSSPKGIRFVGAQIGDTTVYFRASPQDGEVTQELKIPMSELHEKVGDREFQLVLLDGHGQYSFLAAKDFPPLKALTAAGS